MTAEVFTAVKKATIKEIKQYEREQAYLWNHNTNDKKKTLLSSL